MSNLVSFTETSLLTEHPSPFGAAIYSIQTGELISEAYDTVIKNCDPTDHAEMNALRLATSKIQSISLRGCILYSTCEPCPMCMSACIWAELDMVVYGASTLHDADQYWPQASDISPRELVQHMIFEPKCDIIPHVERELCQELFRRCNQVMIERRLRLPPHREKSQ
jgi:tRNA(Arg) A34 adenosine deaminase TadA